MRCKPLLTVMMTAAMLTLSAPGLAEEAQGSAPKQAIGKDTMLAVYVDVTQMNPEMIAGLGGLLTGLADSDALKQEDIALPLGNPQQMIDSLLTLRGSFIEAGGQALMMTVQMPEEESWSPPMTVLAKTNDKFNAQSMSALVRTVGEGEMDATLESIGAGWQNITLKSKEGQAVTMPLPEPDAQAYQAFAKQLSQGKNPMFAVAFRMQEEMREMMDAAEELAKNQQQAGPQDGQDAQAQMAMGMMMGMFKPIRSLDTLGVAVSQVGEGMQVDIQMAFLDAQSAQMFSNLYNSILMFAPVMMAQAGQGGEGGEIPNMPDPNTVNSFFMKLKMQLADDTLKLTLDQEFFDLAEKMAPLFEGIQEQQAQPEPQL